MKFLADAMLGRLAKWLRILGHDTAYFPHAEDRELVRLARAEGRLLLTRDGELARRRGLRSLLVESESFEEQLEQLLRDLDLAGERPPPRCVHCNTILEEVGKETVKETVPPYVFRRHSNFTWCPKCDKVYWRGTHWRRMRERIDEIRERVVSPS
jgi:uncharacterized protein with PIN domain